MYSTQRSMFRRWATLAGALTLAFGVSSANAVGLVGTQVTASLESPGDGLSLTDIVTVVSPGIEIGAGDTTNIGGGAMISNLVSEFIDFNDFTITLRLLNGDPNGFGTGYASGAEYVFSGLSITGFDIVGASITANSGFSNFASSWLSFNDTTDVVSLAIGTMLFSGVTTVDRYGDLTITLQTRANCVPGTPGCGGGGTVPEPGSLALLALGLAGMGVALRRRRTAARPAAS